MLLDRSTPVFPTILTTIIKTANCKFTMNDIRKKNGDQNRSKEINKEIALKTLTTIKSTIFLDAKKTFLL